MKNRFAPLFSATPDALGGNGAAATGETATAAAPLAVVTAEAAAGDDAPAAPAVAAEAETKPGYLETIRASLQSKASLLSERDTFLTRATAAEAELKDAKASITTLTAERDTLRAEKAEIEKMVSELSTEKASVELAAAREVAAMGFDAAKLPAADSTVPETKESLEAAITTEKNAKKRHEMALRLLEMD
jgi:chromosome segregation ATPase